MSPAARFTPLQRALHWIMALCILAMLFIGVHMVSTITPKYLTLIAIHRPLGLVILALALIRLAVRLRSGAPPLPGDLPEPMKLAAHLSHYALYALMIALPLIGWAISRRIVGRLLASADRAAKRPSAYALVACACLSRAAVFRGDPHACRRGAVPCARAARRRLRGHDADADPRGGRHAPAGGIAHYGRSTRRQSP